MKGCAKISVIVPVYKVEKYLDECLNSIVNQTYTNLEIILVDDGSPDRCPQMCDEWARKDKRICVIHKENGGLGSARNKGLEVCTGDFISFIDSDDWIDKDMLKNMVAVADSLSSDAVICPVKSYDDEKKVFIRNAWGSQLPFPGNLAGRNFTLSDISPDIFVSSNAPVTAWNKIYRAEFIQKHQMRFIEKCLYEDNPFYYELIVKGKVSFVQHPYYNYRVNREGSIQNSSNIDESAFDIITVMKSISDMLEENGVKKNYREEFERYMLSEFSWRFQKLSSNKRRFLKSVYDAFSREIYQCFLRQLSEDGENIDGALFQRMGQAIPQVSVIIPVYNNSKDIRECLNSVLTQTNMDLEVCCVDDHSDDDTVAIIKNYCAKDARVKLICKERNSGPGISRNLALEKVNGEFLFFLDGDDLLPKRDVLSKMYQTCKANKKLTCAGNMQCFYNDDITQLSSYTGIVFADREKMSYTEYVPHPTWGFTRFLFNFDIILENGIRFPERRYYEDPLFFVQYMSIKPEFCTIIDCVYLYRQKQIEKEVFFKYKFIDLYTSLKIIFPLLARIGNQLYYAEYHTFLQFCGHLREYLEHNQGDAEELIRGANEIFSLIDFSECEKIDSAPPIYHSYQEMFNMVCTENEKDKLASYTPVKEKKKGENLIKFIKKVIKKLIYPLYRPFRNRFEIPIWEARASIQQTQLQVVRLLNIVEQQGNELSYLQNKMRDMEERQKSMEERQKSMEERRESSQKSLECGIQDVRVQLDFAQKSFERKIDLLEISVNNQEKWDALQIQKRLFNLQFMCEKNFGSKSLQGKKHDIYGYQFYDDNRYESVMSGTEVFRTILPILQPKSILDIGCGTGTWLYVAKRFGVDTVYGIDGDYVNQSMLMIEKEEFEAFDLRNQYQTQKKFDLTLSLEVAEHLEEKYADTFVDTVCANSDMLLFSAAHPGQGGDGHLNEQPFDYWREKIEERGFVHIEIRPLFAKNSNIAWWYKDNIALFVRGKDRYDDVKQKVGDLMNNSKYFLE